MPFCSSCGSEVGSGVAFCPKCGKQISDAPPATAPGIPAGGDAAVGLPQNAAGALCYVLGWVSGLVFYLIDKRPYVRFHAMQSMIVFGAFFAFQYIFVWGGWFGGIFGFGFVNLLASLIGLAALICWILCMVKAFQGQRFKLPVAGDLAENLSK